MKRALGSACLAPAARGAAPESAGRLADVSILNVSPLAFTKRSSPSGTAASSSNTSVRWPLRWRYAMRSANVVGTVWPRAGLAAAPPPAVAAASSACWRSWCSVMTNSERVSAVNTSACSLRTLMTSTPSARVDMPSDSMSASGTAREIFLSIDDTVYTARSVTSTVRLAHLPRRLILVTVSANTRRRSPNFFCTARNGPASRAPT
mmetsp:Transcript_3222/g.7652  ORF Transcript_3222/g.7652 Transcript_3222/m.7652 type:complete len:206 (+) Transcript_3222:265-882(+)